MAYFPMFFSLDGKKILLIGAGYIGSEKLEKLLDFTKDITIIADFISEYVQTQARKYNIKVIEKKYSLGDIKGFDIVIVAIDDIKLQEQIYKECKKQNILCNCVDLQRCCDFIFPSYIKEGDLTVAISTSGSSPAFAKLFKRYIKEKIPEDISTFLKQMRALRKELPKGKDRMQLLEKKVKEYIKRWN
ncbi:MAG: precorrin-2 dehydrogenase/sirohydrochlorin ferrochelatase family protein [Halarcobacter sp.]